MSNSVHLHANSCPLVGQNSGRQALFSRGGRNPAVSPDSHQRTGQQLRRQRLRSVPEQRQAASSRAVTDQGLQVLQTAEVADALAGAATDALGQLEQQASNIAYDPQRQQRVIARRTRRKREQLTYQIAAITASLGVTALGVLAVHYRFAWHRHGSEFPTVEALSTLLLVFGGVIGMEMWARWAHRALWHDFQPGWGLHKSHHEKRIGPFEANDIFAVINAVPAMALCAYGFLTPGQFGGLCFGAGLGITIFGICYMFVHDGLVHKRFPTGPIAQVPYLKRVAAAHKLHHAEKYGGVPWGLFLGPQELEAVGARGDLDRLCAETERQEKLVQQQL